MSDKERESESESDANAKELVVLSPVLRQYLPFSGLPRLFLSLSLSLSLSPFASQTNADQQTPTSRQLSRSTEIVGSV
mgnify:CR=1 FL=1